MRLTHASNWLHHKFRSYVLNQYAFTQFLFNCFVPGHEKIFHTLTFTGFTKQKTQICIVLSLLFALACTPVSCYEAPKHKLQSVIIVKITQSRETKRTILIFDGQNMIHTQSPFYVPLFFMIFRLHIHNNCNFLAWIHKKCTQIYCYRLYYTWNFST